MARDLLFPVPKKAYKYDQVNATTPMLEFEYLHVLRSAMTS